jgi:preprotein translocase SecF subunit
LETNASGPIRGFAVSLIIGLLISLFTSLTCSRFFFDLALLRVSDKKIKGWLAGETALQSRNFHFNFLKYSRGLTMALVILVIAVLGVGFTKGVNFGVDFEGGTEMNIAFAKDIEAEHIRKVADENHIAGLSIQAIGGGQKQFLLRYEETKVHGQGAEAQSAVASDTFNAFKTSILEKLKDYGPDIQQVGFVGPQVGKELRNQGMLSILYAILAVFLYIALRFDIRFGPGAMVKMFLDILVLLGVYVFFGRTFDLVSVAALLTVLGYSLNDTIVVYDRIRENVKDHPRRTWKENINLALNETLSRTLNTSVATSLSLIGILIFGTGQIWDFAFFMFILIVLATLSSIFVASGFVLWMDSWRKGRSTDSQKIEASMVTSSKKL